MMFHQQYGAVTDHSGWERQEMAMHLLGIKQGQTADILRSIPVGETYKHTIGVMKGHYRDHQLSAACQSQL
jgi:hypothetical protein